MLLWTVGYGWAEKGGGGQNRTTAFAAYAKPPEKEKFFLGAPRQHFSTVPKLTEVNKFHLRKPYCELAVQHPFFESQQSCVCCIASLSHRFKSSPAISGKFAVPGTAGYMMMAGHFSENHESSGDLNRGRRTESRVLFMLLFARRKK